MQQSSNSFDTGPPGTSTPAANHAQASLFAPRRPARSKNGCLTCRRRKVRCDEQRPRCSHCERLNLQCKWRPAYAAASESTQWRFVGMGTGVVTGMATGDGDGNDGDGDEDRGSQQAAHALLPLATPDTSSSSSAAQAQHQLFTPLLSDELSRHVAANNLGVHLGLQNPGAVDQLFDYASFMWDSTGDILGQASPEGARLDFGPGYDASGWGAADQFSTPTTTAHVVDGRRQGTLSTSFVDNTSGPPRPSSFAAAGPVSGRVSAAQASSNQLSDDSDLIKYFVRAVVPPILAEVETQKRWASMRQILISMSNACAMVKCAILAFSNLLYHRREVPWMPCPQHHYASALDEILALSARDTTSGGEGIMPPPGKTRPTREQMLATLFFLSYVDILEDRVESAHQHLKRAYGIFQSGNKRGFRPVEIRLLSWIRLLDARTVSAGGEGLFLSDSSEALLIQPSPASAEDPEAEHGGGSGTATGEVKEWDIEDVLFQVLYHPGIVFFQKVQSFMGRISKIDPWHRSRGTVEDEMEVMQVAHGILKDLRDLYDNRPTLMDHAVEGRLVPPHVSASLATAITRAFRTYLSNYHASKVHLHRVAYKHLALSRETTEALRQIRRLTKQLVEALGPGDALPVSQLWPLLMLGSEEKDPAERAWIKDQILQMEKVATNARITAHVLEEVQARQDASNGRVDIRSVMHAIFDSCFAIM